MQPGDIAIGQLRVRTPAGTVRRVAQLVRELEQSAWPLALSAQRQQAWVFVRQLQVAGSTGVMRRQLAQHLELQLQRAMNLRPGVEHEGSIWFESFPQLLSFLLTDIASGKANRWYWARWAHLLRATYPAAGVTRGDSITRALREFAPYVPAVTELLRQQGRLALVWQTITSTQARTVADELTRACQLVSGAAAHQLTDEATSSPIINYLAHHAPLWQPWIPLLPQPAAEDGKTRLAALLVGLQLAPVWLRRHPAAFVAAFAHSLGVAGDARPAVRVGIARAAAQLPLVSPGLDAPSGQIAPAGDVAIQPRPGGFRPTETVTPVTGGVPQARVPHKVIDPDAPSSEPAPPVGPRMTDATPEKMPDDLPQDAPGLLTDSYADAWSTLGGGFFYLINPLQRLLATPSWVGGTAQGWSWLYELARLFCENFPAVEQVLDIPLRRFLAQQWYPARHITPDVLRELDNQPVSDHARRLFAQLWQRYQREPFWQALTQGAGFFATPAQVIATPSHLDVYLPLTAVRLDLRLAAWDLNPGWVFWLGRVVNLHFVDASPRQGARP